MRKPLALSALILAATGTATGAFASTVVIRHVNVIPMDRERILTDQRVRIRDGLIESISPDTSEVLPAASVQVDGKGKYLIPGLVDFHTHPKDGNELLSHLAYGQTTVVTLNGEGKFLPQAKASGLPRVLSASTIIDGIPPASADYRAVANPADAAATVNDEIAQGAKIIKVYSVIKQPEFEAVVRTAHARGVSVVGHFQFDIQPAVTLKGLDLVAHSEEYLRHLSQSPSDKDIDEVVEETARNHVAVIPDLVAYVAIPRHVRSPAAEVGQREAKFLSSITYQEWLPANDGYNNRPNLPAFLARLSNGLVNMKRVTEKLHQRGVMLLGGTDAPVFCYPGRCLIEELELLHGIGLTNYEALQAATANAGSFITEKMRVPVRSGLITPGARADLVLLDSDPLASLDALNNPSGVVLDGKWLSRGQIAARREKGARALIAKHAAVDRYQQLVLSGNQDRLLAFIRRAPLDVLDERVIIGDAFKLQNAGQAQQAIALLETARHLFPKSHASLNVLGRMELGRGNLSAARRDFKAALALSPYDGVALEGLRKAGS